MSQKISKLVIYSCIQKNIQKYWIHPENRLEHFICFELMYACMHACMCVCMCVYNPATEALWLACVGAGAFGALAPGFTLGAMRTARRSLASVSADGCASDALGNFADPAVPQIVYYSMHALKLTINSFYSPRTLSSLPSIPPLYV